jgi:hypothetical protein
MSDTRELRAALEQAQGKVKQLEKALAEQRAPPPRAESATVAQLRTELDVLRRTQAEVVQHETASLMRKLKKLEATLASERAQATSHPEAALANQLRNQFAQLRSTQADAAQRATTDLARRAEKLEQTLLEQRAAHEAAVRAGAEQVSQLRTELAVLRRTQADAVGRETSNLGRRAQKLEETLAGERAAHAATVRANAELVSQLRTQLDALQRAQADTLASQTAALNRRLQKQDGELQPLREALDEALKKVKALERGHEKELDARQSSLARDLSLALARIRELEKPRRR